MADDQHEPHEAAASGAAEPSATADEASASPADPLTTTEAPAEEVVEAELIETETVETVDPAAQASESLAAAAAASAATGPVGAEPVADTVPPAQWQMDGTADAAPQYVVVEAPQAPVRRGNRGIGALLALAGAVVYGGILVGVGWLLEYLAGRGGVAFLQDWHFYLPVILFAVVFVLLVLLVNRAGWWSYILGSLVVGIAVYFGTAAGDALIDEWSRAAQSHSISEGLQAPFVIIAAIIAREVAVWWGSLVALRGRRVTARNRAAREAYDQDIADFRARYGG